MKVGPVNLKRTVDHIEPEVTTCAPGAQDVRCQEATVVRVLSSDRNVFRVSPIRGPPINSHPSLLVSTRRHGLLADQTLPGKWVVSDFLVDRAAADYDMMLSMSASEIEDMKNKVSRADATKK